MSYLPAVTSIIQVRDSFELNIVPFQVFHYVVSCCSIAHCLYMMTAVVHHREKEHLSAGSIDRLPNNPKEQGCYMLHASWNGLDAQALPDS